MDLSAPKAITFWIAVILGVLGVLATLINIPVLTSIAFWMVVVGLVILVLGNLLKGF